MFELPDLPYAENALEPHMSRETLNTHHKKHHAAYVKKTNELLEKSKIKAGTLEEVIRAAHEQGERTLFNQSAQIWNHSFFWNSMTPDYAPPDAEFGKVLEKSFGSLDKLRDEFIKRGVGHFGSGYLWLVRAGDKIELADLHDADTPIKDVGAKPLLNCDLWEHAYYIDRKQARDEYLGVFFDKLINWRFAAEQWNGNAFHFPPAVTKAA
jgi:Fe-Mn family superoxide dismutase